MDLWKKAKKWYDSKQTPKDSSKNNTPPSGWIDDGLETEAEYKERWFSIYIIYFTMFLISLGFGIILTGVWPYLDRLDPTAGKEFMGYVVAANPFAQMLLSPLFGWWSNKLGSIRLPVMSSLAVFTIASAMYSSLEVVADHRKYWMLFTRLLVGVSSACIAPCRSYVSAATRFTERTKAVSMISLAQVLGFVIGPAIQTSVVPLGNHGFWLIKNFIKLDMYTACGWINVVMSIFNFCLFMPRFFKERRIATKEAMLKQGVSTEKDTYDAPDYLSAWTLIIAFFVLVFNFMLLETLGTSLTMDQFAWTKSESLKYMGIMMFIGGIISIICFMMISPLTRKFPEHKVMIWCGFFFMVVGRLVHIPMGDAPPVIYDDSLRVLNQCDNTTFLPIVNETYVDTTLDYLNVTTVPLGILKDEISCNNTLETIELLGCPSSQKWCEYTNAMTLTQFIAGYIFTCFGYPIGVTLIQTIFSKILGPRPQGVWMGLLTGAGCLSRVMGPVFVTYIYTEFGTYWTFGFTAVMMIVSMIWLVFFTDKLEVKEKVKEDVEEATELNNFVTVSLPNVNEIAN
ncbi:major facilitator superfamily domain-containing protein 8-like isoform X2 [Atheta coriaria]